MFASRLTFNPRSKATNIGDWLFGGAVFGWKSKMQNLGFVIFAKFLSALKVDLRILYKADKFPPKKNMVFYNIKSGTSVYFSNQLKKI